MNIDTLKALRERVRDASGADRALDAAITVALRVGCRRDDPEDMPYLLEIHRSDYQCEPGTYWHVSRSGRMLRSSEPLTASIDAALGLVERVLPGWQHVTWGGVFPYPAMAEVRSGAPECIVGKGEAKTLPLAILDALLSALIERGVE